MKIIKYFSYVEIALCIICFLFMFMPTFYLEVGSTHSSFDAFHAIAGVEANGYAIKKYFDFSFLCLLPYLMLIVAIVINVMFDNKNNIILDVLKALIFIASGFMFVFYLKLLNPASFFESVNEALQFVKPKIGHTLTACVAFIGAALCICEVVKDIMIAKKD